MKPVLEWEWVLIFVFLCFVLVLAGIGALEGPR